MIISFPLTSNPSTSGKNKSLDFRPTLDVKTCPQGMLKRWKTERLIDMPGWKKQVINEELKRKLNSRQCNYGGECWSITWSSSLRDAASYNIWSISRGTSPFLREMGGGFVVSRCWSCQRLTKFQDKLHPVNQQQVIFPALIWLMQIID